MINRQLFALQMECASLFQSNPSIVATIDELASRLGSKTEEVEAVIDVLIKQEIVEQIGEAFYPLFRYKQPVTTFARKTTGELETL